MFMVKMTKYDCVLFSFVILTISYVIQCTDYQDFCSEQIASSVGMLISL